VEQSADKESKKKLSREEWKRSWRVIRYLKPYWLPFSAGILLLALSAVLVVIITALLGLLLVPDYSGSLPGGGLSEWIIRMIPAREEWGATGLTLSALIGLLLIQGVFSFFRVYLFSYVSERAMFALRTDTFRNIIGMPLQFFNERRVGDLVSRISADITTIQETLTVTAAEFIRQTIIIVIGVGWLVSQSYKLTLVMLASLPVIIILIAVFGRYIRKLGKQTQDRVAESGVIVNEALTGIVSVKSFANEAFETSRYSRSVSHIRDFAMKSAVWRGMFGTFIIIFLFGALGLVMGVGAWLQQTGELSREILPQFIMITGLVAGSIGGLASQMGSLQRSFGTISSVMELLEMKPETINESAPRVLPGFKGRIRFRDVRFAYPSRRDIPVLRGVSFEVGEGMQVALVGSSGSGKSTIASLLQRFYEPNAGEILVDDRPVTAYDLTSLRSQMAYVPQEVILFGGTIRENIAYGKPEATDEEIAEAARKANAFEFIASFPSGFDTVVGERGIQLSGGQRQRIAIARAVLRNPAILILDEATSSLDSESESVVQAALDELMKGRTSLVIAHRLSTIRSADLILVLDQGEVKESGTHAQLMALSGGLYRKLVELQYESEHSR
jgi:ABC-type multidrug transport system fused ATPase/permease subunit